MKKNAKQFGVVLLVVAAVLLLLTVFRYAGADSSLSREMKEIWGVELPEGDYDTIAGLVTDLLGRIPKEDETPCVQIKNLTITVLEIEDQRLARLHISRSDPAEISNEEENEENEE